MRKEAIALLASLAHEVLPDGDAHDFGATVTDAGGRPLFRATLSLRAEWLDGQEPSHTHQSAQVPLIVG